MNKNSTVNVPPPAGRLLLEELESSILAPYAARSGESRGRKYNEPAHAYRTEFQRDRERIIHSHAFRRLEYKTQVFISHEGDHLRNRLTHTIEVAQISRSIARSLRLNEDLAESISLAHDLGHTPFGHNGERMLNKLMTNSGGFEHNAQSLRIVEKLENRYSNFSGLNLTFETREGLSQHSDDRRVCSEGICKGEYPTLEAQIIEFADEIAYNNHDLDDGLSSGFLHLEEIEKLELWQLAGDSLKSTGTELPTDQKLLINLYVRSMINLLVSDLINTSAQNIIRLNICNLNEARHSQEVVINFSEKINKANNKLKKFLFENLYRHYKIVQMGIKAERIIEELFTIYVSNPRALPAEYYGRIESEGIERCVADYIAGMTDRYALQEYEKLTDPSIWV